MSTKVAGRRGLVALITVMCLLPVHHPASVLSGAAQANGCGPSMQGVDRLRADLGLDNALASRASSLASSALRTGQPPPPEALNSLTEDGFDGLKDAGDQLDQAAGEIGKQLDTMNLPRQQRTWGQALDNVKKARTKIHYPTRQELTAGSTSAIGIGPKVMYEAANDYQSAVQSLNSIADQSGFVELGQKSWIAQGKPDTPPPQNPGPDPWQEWLKRLQAQQARILNNINALNAAQAMRAGQFQQAQQNVAEMQKAIQSVQSLANQLGQMVAACNQAANQRPQQTTQSTPQSTPPRGGASTPPAGATTAAAGGGSGAGLLVGALVVGAGAGGYALYKASQCKEPDFQSNLTACGTGSCSGCVALGQKLVPWCDCLEKKHPNEAGGLSDACQDYLTQMRNIQAYYRCDAPANFSPAPVR